MFGQPKDQRVAAAVGKVQAREAAEPDVAKTPFQEVLRRHTSIDNGLAGTCVEQEVEFSNRTLFQTPGFDGAAFVNRGRFMMLLVAVGLGGFLMWVSYQLCGPIAAIKSPFAPRTSRRAAIPAAAIASVLWPSFASIR